jgi:BarA-like signal transduction histidine kinase
MVFNATFNSISILSWWLILLVEETGVPVEKHQPAASHWQTLAHNVVLNTSCHEHYSNSQLKQHGCHQCNCKINLQCNTILGLAWTWKTNRLSVQI